MTWVLVLSSVCFLLRTSAWLIVRYHHGTIVKQTSRRALSGCPPGERAEVIEALGSLAVGLRVESGPGNPVAQLRGKSRQAGDRPSVS